MTRMSDDRHNERDLKAQDRRERQGDTLRFVARIMAAIRARFPVGYEDEDGFHFGADPHRLH